MNETYLTDLGWVDCGEGWFDVQGQGVKNDYCRWVGKCGCRNERRDEQGGVNCSWWSCALAGAQRQYTDRRQFYEGM